MKRLFVIVCLIFPVHGYCAELLSAGDAFPKFVAKDQHGAEYAFSAGTQTVLIAFDMKAGKRANKFLAAQGAEYLDDHKAVYVANIYGMPGIGRMFALPKMKKYPHRIILADNKTLLTPFPQSENQVTVIKLDSAGTVQAIDFWNPADGSLQF